MNKRLVVIVLLLIAGGRVQAGTATLSTSPPALQTDGSEQYIIVSSEDAETTGVTYSVTTSTKNGVDVSNWEWTATNVAGGTSPSQTGSSSATFTYSDAAYGQENPTTLNLAHGNSDNSQPFCTLLSGPPVSTINAYMATIEAQNPASGEEDNPTFTPINDTNENRNFVVGEPVTLRVFVPGGHQPAAYQWTLPGTTFKSYNPDNSSAGYHPLGSGDLNGSSVSFYWSSGGDNQKVTCTITVNSVNYNINATVNVKRPTNSSIMATGGSVAVVSQSIYKHPFPPAGTTNYLICGDAYQNIPLPVGMKFVGSETDPEAFPGTIAWVQIISSDVLTETFNDGNTVPSAAPAPGLDQQFPYDTSATTSDSPAAPLDGTTTQVKRQFAATMYLIWQPNISGAAWVPLRKVSWSFTGVANRGTGWTLDAGASTSPPASPLDSDDSTESDINYTQNSHP